MGKCVKMSFCFFEVEKFNSIALEEGRMVFYHEWYKCDILDLIWN